ncbi:cysteine proteinase [Venturia nashicola]|uniref:Cysteine proteinase n=1 Tax=Venturia nashicola TaxID=86259 RepID=A0A4Z1P796_9PEZI|nr:cysteine proteinase [Venturia nashicola]
MAAPHHRETRRLIRGEAPAVPPSRNGSPVRIVSSRPPSITIPDEQAQTQARHRRQVPKRQHPQKTIDQFWSTFTSKEPGKPFSVLPDNGYAKRAAAQTPTGVKNVLASYGEARASCEAKVTKIVKECRRTNQKYTDPHFNIEADFRRWGSERHFSDCLMGLLDDRTQLRPASVKRVEDIFEKPQFFIEGATASDVRQGKEGDCWFMSALCTLSNKEGLLESVCVARDEKVGVYGFVFHRDGEWISEVIDDKLYLIKEDFNEATLERNKWLELQNRTSPEEEYRTVMQTGSRALYFAQCSDPNETWLPLLEKAFAKAHGDYAALESGFVGEGIEDLTGGVTTELYSTDILDKEKFWKEELMNVNKEFLFGCGTMDGKHGERNGILEKHAYSIMEAREVEGKRLLKLRNPWGNTEWRGAWSDGAKEWTPEWMKLLDHQFGDDGVFWISYSDLLRNYQHFDRTRLFGQDWTVTQQWTSLNVPWTVDYLDTKFKFTLTKQSEVIIVLSQIDERYFRGLEGQYEFHLQFRLHKDDEDEYIVRSNQSYYMKRSVTTELQLEPGDYTVLLKIVAKRYPEDPTVEEVVAKTCQFRREKLLRIGLSYDLAHAKGGFRELEAEKKEAETADRRKKRKETAMKMHQARVTLHKKQKLRTLKMNWKKQAKAPKKMTEAAEEQAKQEKRDKRKQEKHDTLEKRMEEFKFDDPEGLGIAVNGNGHDQGSEVIKPPQRTETPEQIPLSSPPVGPPRPRTDTWTHHSAMRQAVRPSQSRSISSGSPYVGATLGSNMPRRDTLTIAPPVAIHSAGFGMPGIQVHKPSISGNGRPTLSDISDDDLSWDSEVDNPSDSEIDESPNLPPQSDAYSSHPKNPNHKSSSQPEEEEEDEFAKDPWNAVCVVGLRVYSRDSELRIDVERGNGALRNGDLFLEDQMRGLDVDDASKDPSREPVSPSSGKLEGSGRGYAERSLMGVVLGME